MNLRLAKALRWAVASLAVLAVVIAAALFLAPRLVDLPSVRAQIQRELSDAMQGQVAWDDLEVQLFPYPYAVVRNASASIPDRLTARVERIDVGLRLLPLLRGKAEVQSVHLVGPFVEVRLPAATADQTSAASTTARDPITIYRSVMQPAVNAIREFAPDILLIIESGSFDLQVPDLPVIGARDLSVRAQSDSSGFAVSATAVGKYWQQVRINARLEFADLHARATVDTVGIKPQTFLDHYLRDSQPHIDLPTLRLHAEASTDAKTSISIKLHTEAPATTLSRGNKYFEVREVRLDGIVEVTAEGTEVVLRDVQLGELLSAGQARLSLGGPQRRWQGSVAIPKLDLSRLRAAALALAGDEPMVSNYAGRIRNGQISDFQFSTEGETLSELFRLPGMSATLSLTDGSALLPVIDQEARDIQAGVELTDGKLKVRSAGARIGESRLVDGSLDLDFRDMHIETTAGFDLELSRALQVTRRILPAQQRSALDHIQAVAGKAQGSVEAAVHGEQWSVQLDIAGSDSLLRMRDIPWPIAVRQGRVTASPKRVQLANLNGSIGASMLREGTADLALSGGPRLQAASARATLSLDEIYPWLRSQKSLAKALTPVQAVSGSVEVTLHSLSGSPDQPSKLAYDVTVAPRQAGVRIRDLPAPVLADGGLIRIAPETLQLGGFGVCDAGLRSPHLRHGSWISRERCAGRRHNRRRHGGREIHRLGVAAGRDCAATGTCDTASLVRPARTLEQEQGNRACGYRATPRWAESGRRSSLAAEAASDQAPFDQGFTQQCRYRLRDARPGTGWKFSGELAVRSVASVFRHIPANTRGGSRGISGFKLPRDQPAQFSAHGRLAGERLNLGLVLPVPLTLERFSIEADATTLRLKEVLLEWAEQKAAFHGNIAHTSAGLVVDAQVDSAGIVIDRLLPAPAEAQDKATARVPDKSPQALKVWPLPISGKLIVNADFLESHGFRVQPVRATLTMQPERVHMDVAEAALCGIAFPFLAAATPQGFNVAARVSAKDQQLEEVAKCFTEQHVLITGRFDLTAELTSKGALGDLFKNLEGPLQFEARDGEIRKFALLGNILALKDVSSLLKKGFTPDAEGFSYRTLAFRAHMGEGAFTIEQGSLDSNAVGLAVAGKIGLVDRQADLTVLVAPFSSLDRLVRKIPLVGYIIGGAITSVPVGVKGDIRDPTVTPLGAKAVSTEVLGIFERTFKLPGKLLAPLTTQPPAK